MKEAVKVLFWDIDGTLILTDGAGMDAWEQAAAEILGLEVSLRKMKTAGLTDWGITFQVMDAFGIERDEKLAARLLDRYEKLLPEHLPKRKGFVLPQVREILDFLKTRTDVVSFLLTGNTERGGQQKLDFFNLGHYFEKGVFSEPFLDRKEIAKNALRMARDEYPQLALQDVYVIGDTPHDIICGQAIQARTVSVLTGPYKKVDLLPYQPWCLFESLPVPSEFVKKMGFEPE